MPPPSPQVVLAYSPETSPRRRGPLEVVFLLLGLPAVAAVFLPFIADVSPAGAILDSYRLFVPTRWDPMMVITLMALPLLLPVLVSWLRLRRMLWGPATPAERGLGLTTASLAGAAVSVVLVLNIPGVPSLDVTRRVAFFSAAAVLAGGGVVLALLLRRGESADVRVRAALLVPYAADCLLLLLEFVHDRHVGWYLTAVSAPAALAELVLLSVRQRETRAGLAV